MLPSLLQVSDGWSDPRFQPWSLGSVARPCLGEAPHRAGKLPWLSCLWFSSGCRAEAPGSLLRAHAPDLPHQLNQYLKWDQECLLYTFEFPDNH